MSYASGCFRWGPPGTGVVRWWIRNTGALAFLRLGSKTGLTRAEKWLKRPKRARKPYTYRNGTWRAVGSKKPPKSRPGACWLRAGMQVADAEGFRHSASCFARSVRRSVSISHPPAAMKSPAAARAAAPGCDERLNLAVDRVLAGESAHTAGVPRIACAPARCGADPRLMVCAVRTRRGRGQLLPPSPNPPPTP